MAGDITPYLSLVTSEYFGKPKFTAALSAVLQPFADTLASVNSIPGLLDLDAAQGTQLDLVGLWVGATRNLQLAITGVYFAWDTVGLGWDQGSWQGPGDPSTGLVVLPDAQYRTLLRAKVADNAWNGTIPGAYAVGEVIFGRNPSLAPSFVWQQRINTTADYTAPFNSTMSTGAGPTPDGTTDGLVWTRSSAAAAYAGVAFNVPTPQLVWTISLSAKPNGANFITMKLQMDPSGAAEYCFDLLNGVVALGPMLDGPSLPSGYANVSASIVPQTNGWYRCSITVQPLYNNTNAYLLFSGYTTARSTIAEVDTAPNSSIWIYGGRLEQAAAPAPYQNDITITDNENMTMTLTVRGPPLDALTKAMVLGGVLDLKPAGVLATYVTP